MDFAQCVNSHSAGNWEEDHSSEMPEKCQRCGLHRVRVNSATARSSRTLQVHWLQAAAAWARTVQQQLRGGEEKRKSEVKQHLRVTHLCLESSNVAPALSLQ